jgi:pimeloyl-ACP methyl ester carboxylesterase
MTEVATAAVLVQHGRELAYREIAGTGIPIMLIHGIGSSSATWGDIPDRLAATGAHVIVVDLPGHGQSSKQPGDYSLGSLASSLRDLIDHLDIARVHLVGHSLGGGVSLQFSYQFPERVQSIVLVSSGGLGVEAFTGLRAAALPGSELAIRWALNDRTLAAASWAGRQLRRIGLTPNALSPGAIETASWLADEDRRTAFLSTLRSVVNVKGQRVSALEKLHLLNGSSVLIIWGDSDPMIPMEHGVNAHELLPGSRLVIFPGATHEPHVQDPQRFTDLIVEHIQRNS